MTFDTPPHHYPAPMAPLDPVGSTLLKAAGDLLAAEGPGALTVRRIANAAGVSTMNVYSRFGGKDGVVEHLFVEGFTRLGDGMRAVVATDDPIADLNYVRVVVSPVRHRPPDAVLGDVRSGRPRFSTISRGPVDRRVDARTARDSNRTGDEGRAVATGRSTAHCGTRVGDVSRRCQPRAEGSGDRGHRFDWPEVYQRALDMIVQGLA